MALAEPTLKVSVRAITEWQVGYHPVHDELFLWFTDQDDLVWVFRKGGLDSMGFWEFMNLDAAVQLGEL